MRGTFQGPVGYCIALVLTTWGHAAPALGETYGALTLVEGRVTLVRGVGVYGAAAGVPVQDGDILTVEPNAQAQAEFEDGAILNFGPGTRVMVTSASQRGAPRQIVIESLSGWIKFTHKGSAARSRPYRWVTPVVEIVPQESTIVLNAGKDVAELFVESGSARLYEVQGRRAGKTGREMKAGDFAVRKRGQTTVYTARLPAEFIKNMPRHFRDNLPVLADRFKNRRTEPRLEHDVTYADVEAWLTADSPARRGLVTRFEPRSHDPEFRRRLIGNLQLHPEWDRILFPEKYESKEEKQDSKRAQTVNPK